ncbi:hypothetical protein ANANG_G00035510 [Anguilla anguilla]|uniref:Uncharacterized protein n=1 Tax=Anguilla anguilla TaxID=7936 RepID=A0A0E9WSJ2_ANGAN|nr:hypothetical protein ANANG_G00035510 [Anguilla anguilla]
MQLIEPDRKYCTAQPATAVLLFLIYNSTAVTRQTDMAIESVPASPGADGTVLDWGEWALHRLQVEPWALGGAVVIAAFLAGFLALLLFALIYGCCSAASRNKTNRNGVV